MHARMSSTNAMWSVSGKCPLGPWRTRHASGRARPLESTWIISAAQPRPTTLPSITNTRVSKAQCVNKISAFGRKVHLLQDALVVDPPGKAFDAALGLGAIGHFGSEGGQLRALAAHDAADERGEGLYMSSEVACWRSRIGWRKGVADGPIAAKDVTHRPFLLLLV